MDTGKVRIKRVKKLDTQIHLNVPVWFKDAAAGVASDAGVNLSDYIRDLVMQDLKEREVVQRKLDGVA